MSHKNYSFLSVQENKDLRNAREATADILARYEKKLESDEDFLHDLAKKYQRGGKRVSRKRTSRRRTARKRVSRKRTLRKRQRVSKRKCTIRKRK